MDWGHWTLAGIALFLVAIVAIKRVRFRAVHLRIDYETREGKRNDSYEEASKDRDTSESD
jgi:hypothetical protein